MIFTLKKIFLDYLKGVVLKAGHLLDDESVRNKSRLSLRNEISTVGVCRDLKSDHCKSRLFEDQISNGPFFDGLSC